MTHTIDPITCTINSKDALINKIKTSNIQQLTADAFDFDVNMRNDDIFDAYSELQQMYNKSTVIQYDLDSVKIKTAMNNVIVEGRQMRTPIPGKYKGNLKNFLTDMNDSVKITGWCRINTVFNRGNIIGGHLLEFCS